MKFIVVRESPKARMPFAPIWISAHTCSLGQIFGLRETYPTLDAAEADARRFERFVAKDSYCYSAAQVIPTTNVKDCDEE